MLSSSPSGSAARISRQMTMARFSDDGMRSANHGTSRLRLRWSRWRSTRSSAMRFRTFRSST